MKKINLIYWDEDNFGDALNPVLVEELSGRPTQYKDVNLSIADRRAIVLNSIKEWNFKAFHTILFPWQSVLACIGSIISWLPKNATVWGAGFMNAHEQFRGGTTLAVRGRLTDEKLQAEGYAACGIYGDPALLLPLWMKPTVQKVHKLGLIPHWKEVDYFIEHYGSQYHIIDLRTRDIEKVVNEISSCEYILSTSLHGVIVAHAYEVPALWIKKGYIDTDGFKFHDYFSSVDIPFYDGFEHFEQMLTEGEGWKVLFDEHKDKAGLNNSLKDIQKGLLKAAPFPLKEKYRQWTSST